MDPKHVKSLFRMSKVYCALIDYDAALKVLLEAQSISDTKEIQKEILIVKKSIAEKNASDKKVHIFYLVLHYSSKIYIFFFSDFIGIRRIFQ